MEHGGVGFGCWGTVLGCGGADLGRWRTGLGLGVVCLGMGISGLGEGQFGLTTYRVGFWGSVGCVGAWGIGIWDWRGGRGLGWADFGFWRAVLGCSVPATKQLSTSETIKKIDKRKKNTHKRARKPTKQIDKRITPRSSLDRGMCPYEHNFHGQNTPATNTQIGNK